MGLFQIGLKDEEKELLYRLVALLERLEVQGITIKITVGDKNVDDLRK